MKFFAAVITTEAVQIIGFLSQEDLKRFQSSVEYLAYIQAKDWEHAKCLEITVEFDAKPIPIRSCDWTAHLTDDPEFGTATGLTRELALEDLKNMLEPHYL